MSAYEADVDSLINDVLLMVDSKTNSIEKGYLEKRLYDRIVGNDGWLDYGDVVNAKNNIQGIVNHIMNDKN